MKMGTFKRMISSDYPQENQKLVEQLGLQLNDGIEQLYTATSGQLTFADNFLATVRDVEITTGQFLPVDPLNPTRSTGVPINRTSILLNNTNIVIGTLVISAVNKSDPTIFPTSTPFISFTQNGSALYIDNITSLQANNRYLVKVIAFN